MIFLSTPSARRATTVPAGRCRTEAISIHALREEGDLCAVHLRCMRQISIHALREEGDADKPQHIEPNGHFYPRPPRGGRLSDFDCTELLLTISIHALREEGDVDGNGEIVTEPISIHALREEGDQTDTKLAMTLANFYPRPPRGGRLCAPCKIRFETLFLSTPSARRATSPSLFPILTAKHFYPRPPRGGRPVPIALLKLLDTISIHALREEGDGFSKYRISR